MLPLTIIVVTLSILNLEHVVFDLMSGISPGEASANDAKADRSGAAVDTPSESGPNS